MIYRCQSYFLDCGRQYYFCPLKITAPIALVPFNLANLLTPADLGYCALPLTPRYAKLTMTNGEIFLIEYPFFASMPENLIFWQKLRENPEIAFLEGKGESIPDRSLRSWLFS